MKVLNEIKLYIKDFIALYYYKKIMKYKCRYFKKGKYNLLKNNKNFRKYCTKYENYYYFSAKNCKERGE